jgi:hypothetical protein
MKRILISLLMSIYALTSFSQSETGVRVFSGKGTFTQTGGDADEWFVNITDFNSVAGDAADIEVGHFLGVYDAGTVYWLEITLITSASGSNASVRVSKVGITGISSVPTGAGNVSARTTNFKLYPWFANSSGPNNQLAQEYMVYLIDSILNANLGTSNVFRTNSVTPTLANIQPTGVTPVANNPIFLLKNGSTGYYNGSSWVKMTSDNGFNVPYSLKETVTGGPLYTSNLNRGNRFYVEAGADGAFFGVPDSLNQQSPGEIFVFEVYNSTGSDTINITFDEGAFRNKAERSISETMGAVPVYPGESVMIPFEVVLYGELIFLQTLADWNRSDVSGFYLPTITKNLSTDTIVEVFDHHYFKSGDEVLLVGKVKVNNTAGTVASSFRISFPPGITSNFTNDLNDISGPVTNRKELSFDDALTGFPYADTSNDRVTIAYNCDGNAPIRQFIEYAVVFKIK